MFENSKLSKDAGGTEKTRGTRLKVRESKYHKRKLMKVIKKNIFENNGENKKQNKEELLIERKTPLSREELLFTIPLAYHIWSRWEFYRIPFQKTFHEDESKKGGQMFLQIPMFYC